MYVCVCVCTHMRTHFPLSVFWRPNWRRLLELTLLVICDILPWILNTLSYKNTYIHTPWLCLSESVCAFNRHTHTQTHTDTHTHYRLACLPVRGGSAPTRCDQAADDYNSCVCTALCDKACTCAHKHTQRHTGSLHESYSSEIRPKKHDRTWVIPQVILLAKQQFAFFLLYNSDLRLCRSHICVCVCVCVCDSKCLK